MYQVDLHAERLVQVLGQVLGRVNGTVLATRAAEADRQVRKAAFHVAFHRSVHQTVNMLQEGCDFTVVLQKADDGFVQSREGLIAFIFAGIVYGTAVEHKASAVARRIFGNTFLIGKAGDLDHEAAFLQLVGELLQFGQLSQNLAQVGVFRIGLTQQLAQVFDGEGHALDKVRLLLEVTAEAVGTEHLHGAEQHGAMK